MRYSATSNGFYLDDYSGMENAPDLPNDLVIIDDQLYAELMGASIVGKHIEPDGDGFPVLVDNAELTDSEIEDIVESSISEIMDEPLMSALFDELEKIDSGITERVKTKAKKKEKDKIKDKDK